MLTKFQQGRQSRVGQLFAIELIKDFMKASESEKLAESIKTQKLVNNWSGPTLVVKSYAGRSNQFL